LYVLSSEPVKMPWFDSIFSNIGDENSLSQSPSTFSGHLKQTSVRSSASFVFPTTRASERIGDIDVLIKRAERCLKAGADMISSDAEAFGDGVLVELAVVLVDPSSTSTGQTTLAVWTQEVACLYLSEETLNCSFDGISSLSDDEAS
nr:DNA mismatch repair protein MutS, core [Tanacetum cinerariifolium]